MSCTVTPASSTGQGFFILPNPEIDFCVTNNCFQHCVTTGASGHLYNDSVLDSLNIQNINLDVPEHFDNEAISNRTGVYHGLIVKSGLVDFDVENSQVGLFEGGFIKTEASLALDLSEQETWSVDFWINTQNDYTGIENAPYGTKDIALFTISGEVGAENGNTLFSVGYTLESGVSGISGLQKTVKPYSDFSGIQSDENYYTGFFTDSGVWQHFAFVKEYTGYATYLDGYRVGKVIPKNQLDPYVPSGRSIFYFGGLPSGKFEPFNTGQNQQFATGSDVDLLLHFNDNLVDSGRYEQTIVSGGFPVFQTDSKYGGYSVNFTGLEYIETSGEHFNYGTGDFTIECWVKPSGITKGTNITGNAVQTLWALGKDGGSFTTGNGIALLLNYHTNGLRLAFAPDNQEMQVDLFPPFKPTRVEVGEWNHIALQRENNVFYSFINGIPAGAFGDSDFAQNAIISQYFTGNPVFDFGSDQKFFIGGTMEGNKTTFVVPTGDLYDTQPSKLDRAASLETLGLVKKSNPLDPYTNRYITYKDQFPLNTAEVNKPYFAYHNIVGVPVGTGSGYAYDYKCSPSFTGDLYVYASCTSRWGRAINTNGVSTSVARLFKDDVESAELRWEHGGDSVYSDDPRYSPDKDYLIGTFKDDPNFLDGSPGQSIRGKYYPPFMSGCYTDVFLAHKITGFSSGQEFKFVCNRYGNEGIIGNTKFNDSTLPDSADFDNGAANMLNAMHRLRLDAVAQPINSARYKYQNLDYVNFYDSKTFLKLPRQTAAGADIVHINSLIIKQTLHENFVGQIDELRISSGVARYSSESPTGIYDSGFLNSDLGDRVFIDNLILSKAPAFSYDNGAYEMPTSGNTQADNFNFETPIDLGNIVTNGITGSAGANAILKTYEIVGPNSGTNVRFSESGNAKFGDYSAQFPTGAPMTGSGNFLFSDYDINFNTGDFTVEFWFKPSGNAYDDGIVEPTFLFGTGTGLGQTPTTGDITGTGIPTTGEAVSGNLDAQTLFSIGDYNSGFNIFLTGNYAQEADTSGVARDLRIGLNLSNGRDLLDTTGTASGDVFDTNAEPVGSERFHIFEQYGADSQWISGDWNHLAFSRKDRNFYLHLNGRFAGNINYTGVSPYSGFSNSDAFGQENPLTGITPFDGYNFYLENDQPDGSTVFEDSITIAGGKGLEIIGYGGITHSTEQRVVGSSSIYFNGYDQYLSLPTFPDYGTGDFTMESWIWPQSVGVFSSIFSSFAQGRNRFGGGNIWAFTIRNHNMSLDNGGNLVEDGTGVLQAYWYGQGKLATDPEGNVTDEGFAYDSLYYVPRYYRGPEVPTGEWSHVAVCRENGIIKMFINGEFMNSSLSGGYRAQTHNHPAFTEQARVLSSRHEIKRYTPSVTIGRFASDEITTNYSGLHYYKGYMDGIKLSDHARFTGEKLGDTNPTSSFSGDAQEPDLSADVNLLGINNDDYTKLQHIGSDNFYITGESGCHNMNISGRMVFGGGCAYVSNYQGEIDAINISLGTPYTGIYSAPKHLHTCDKDDLLVVKFDRPSGSVYFEDSHCCATGVEGTGRWGEIVGIHGSGFFDITGILFGANRVPSRDWFVPEREYINATIPQGAESGPTVIVGSGFSEITGCHLEIIPIDTEIYGFSPASGFTNQTISVSGQSLNRFENIFIFDNSGQRLQIPFTRTDFTGITFTIPTGIDCALPTHTDIIFSGSPQFIPTNTSGEVRTGTLRINSSGIKSVSVGSGVFGEEISFSGSYFNSGVDIPMFPAYQTGASIYDADYVQTNYVPALDIEYIGVTGITAKVPKEIVHGDLILSGSGLSGAAFSDPSNPAALDIISTVVNINCGKQFVPIPTITGVTKTLYKNGSSIVITGVNACYIHPYIGFTGSNVQAFHSNSDPVNQNIHSQVSFIANSGNIEEYLSGLNEISGVGYGQLYPSAIGDSTSGYNDVMYNGNIFINKDQLDINYPESSKTGFVIISGFINSTTIGTGNPFLVSAKEISNGEYYDSGDYGVSGFKDNFFNTGSFVYARDNISSVTGDQIEISGNCPDFSGLILGGGLYWASPATGNENTLVTISGLHFADLTGIKVEANDGSTMCHISTGDFDRFVELETGFNEATNNTEVFAIRTGHHFDRFYQGTGEYINPINWINRAELNLCSELRNNQNVTISPLYNSGTCTTGII